MTRATLKWLDLRGESFRSEGISSTTSNAWVDKLTGTTQQLEAGSVLISQFAELAQSKASRELGHRVQWKPSSSAIWIDVSETNDGVAKDNYYQPRSCWDIVQLPANDTIDFRVQYGQTNNGGTASIRKVRVAVVRVGQLGEFL